MIENHPGSYDLSQGDKERIFKKATIVFDTDVFEKIVLLSNNYYVTFTNLLSKSKVLKRIWIPDNVNYQYHKNLCPEQNYRRTMYARLFTKKMLGKGFNKAQYAYLYKRAQERYDKRIPPGRIGGSTDKRIIYHDYLIWKEMQAYAGESKKDIILVKSLVNEIWFENGRFGYYTNHTIANEFYEQTKTDFDLKTGRRFFACDITKFLDLCYTLVGNIMDGFNELKKHFVPTVDFGVPERDDAVQTDSNVQVNDADQSDDNTPTDGNTQAGGNAQTDNAAQNNVRVVKEAEVQPLIVETHNENS